MDEDGPGNPNTVHFFYPPLLLGFYSAFREACLADGALTRKQKEILGSFVSSFNTCSFCTNMHQIFAKSQGADIDEVRMAVAVSDPSLLSDKHLSDIIRWMKLAQQKNPQEIIKPDVYEGEIPEILGTAFLYNYINRVVDLFITQDKIFPAIPGIVRFLYDRSQLVKSFVESWMVKNVFLNKTVLPGESADLMDHFPDLPEDMSWAKSSKPVRQAFAYWAWAIDALAEAYLPKNVVEFVGKYIDEHYDGTTPPLSRNWVFSAAEEMEGSEAERFAASFMLLVAFARFQIDDSFLADLEKRFPDFDVRRAMCMWASFRTARNIANWQHAFIAA
ncbi:hypothetical protein BSKO_06875 [Bryopsis sp. KO-2023]|nr:hypothetical protein BSKO_06875 [Bryopsis sp. KO-2023]